MGFRVGGARSRVGVLRADCKRELQHILEVDRAALRLDQLQLQQNANSTMVLASRDVAAMFQQVWCGTMLRPSWEPRFQTIPNAHRKFVERGCGLKRGPSRESSLMHLPNGLCKSMPVGDRHADRQTHTHTQQRLAVQTC